MADEETTTEVAEAKPPKAAAQATLDAAEAEESGRGNDRRLVGRVVNDTSKEGRAKKTIVVEVIRRTRDRFYGKYVKKKKKYHAHDENEEFRTRDLVEIKSCRPMSKTKRWKAQRLIERPPEV